MEARHDSVLMKEVLDALEIKRDDTVVDTTVGGAGHFSAMLSKLGGGGTIIGIDADEEAVERGKEAYALDRRTDRPTAHVINDNFRNITHILERLGIGKVDEILFDLGWSGYQIASSRGFSFKNDEPLLMTYGASEHTNNTVADLVNSSTEKDLADIIFTYGEERFSRGIAKAIVTERAKERILTTNALVKAIEIGTPQWYHNRKIHPATKTFQAFRIAVNDELGSLREGLAGALEILAPSGRLAVISFHSIEDRIVKNILHNAVKAELGILVSKKPIAPSRAEVLENRRARSAKLRIFERNGAPLTVGTTPSHIAYA